ncbi:MAG: c-type cytochrome [Bacteroidia bacterium]|jgi:mono/diheme cytochrome c family protein|nr:c-type cytochrome [Bacteroidia bacterium]
MESALTNPKPISKVTVIIITVLLILLLTIVSIAVYVVGYLPNVGEPEAIEIVMLPERVSRGQYLANHVTVCIDCHSTRDWSLFSGPVVAGTFGKGGEVFDQKMGFPGKFYAKNITSGALSSWSDGELLRAISSGVNKDNQPLFPVMPHPAYGRMDKEDLFDIIAYIRTLPNIKNDVPAAVPDFPMNIILNTIPQKAQYNQKPDTTNIVAYGQYLFNAAACGDCHTKQNKGEPIEGMELAGGFAFPLPTGGTVVSANITPHHTGIGTWGKEEFVHAFKKYAGKDFVAQKIEPGGFNTVMPWSMYAGMKTKDLEAIYAYLRTVKPIENQVTRFISGAK